MKLILASLFLIYFQSLPAQNQGEDPPTYIDFKCHPNYNKERDDLYREMCTEEFMSQRGYEYTPRSKCPKSCLLHQWHVLMSMGERFEDPNVWFGSFPANELEFPIFKRHAERNVEQAESYLKQIQENCQKDVDLINGNHKLHCSESEWDGLYSCVENIVTCK